MNETEEMANDIAKICPDKVDDYCSCSSGTPCYVCLSKALIDLDYRKVKSIIIKINDKVEIHCDTMEDYDAFLKEITKDVVKEDYSADNHKSEVKTNCDRIRVAWSNKYDKSLADSYITYTNNPNPRSPQYYSELLNKYFFSRKQALKANLEYLNRNIMGE